MEITTKKALVLAIAILTLFSLNATASTKAERKAMDEKVKSMSKCEQVKALVNAHQNGFKKIRKTKSNTKLADIWTARYHLVGEGCQIFRWSNKKTSYMCTVTSPGEDVAMERFKMAKEKLESCLGDTWTLKERPRNNGKGIIAVYKQKGSKTVVATHAFATNGIFNDEWTNYIFVGNQKRIK